MKQVALLVLSFVFVITAANVKAQTADIPACPL